MICLPDVKMPNNCHECDAYGISDVVGLKCPCEQNLELYDYEKRPEKCPLKEIKDADLKQKCGDAKCSRTVVQQ